MPEAEEIESRTILIPSCTDGETLHDNREKLGRCRRTKLRRQSRILKAFAEGRHGKMNEAFSQSGGFT